MYFDPAFARQSVGTYSILWEIEYARKLGLPHYYLGYYVAESDTMSYKARFRPNEMLVADNHWIRLGE
jgi:arginine-tRNA-protein transferase